MTLGEHPTRFVIEQLSVDDLPAEVRAQVEAHVGGCARCAAIFDELGRAKETQLATHPPEHFMMQVAARRARARRGRLATMGTVSVVLAAAAALVLFVRPAEEIRFKGGGMDVLRRRGAEDKRLGPDDRILAGDALQVVVSRSKPGRVGAWAIDSDGRIDPLTDGLMPVGAGDSSLPASAVVEAPCRDLWLVVAEGDWTSASLKALSQRLSEGREPPPQVTARRLRCQ